MKFFADLLLVFSDLVETELTWTFQSQIVWGLAFSLPFVYLSFITFHWLPGTIIRKMQSCGYHCEVMLIKILHSLGAKLGLLVLVATIHCN